MRPRLDSTDVRILAALEQHGRMQNQQLADLISLSPGACSQRFRRLEKQKIITGYRARIDLRQVCNAVSFMAVVYLSQQGGQKQNKFLAALQDIPAVVECFEVAGAADFIVKFCCVDTEEYHAYILALLSDEKLGVSRVETHVILRHIGGLERSNTLHLLAREYGDKLAGASFDEVRI